MTKLIPLGTYFPPLKKVPRSKGFGHYGVLKVTPDLKLLQCHLCSAVFEEVGIHIVQHHKISIEEYKKQFGLPHSTTLASPFAIERRKRLYHVWLDKKTPEEKVAYFKRQKRISAKGRKSIKNFSHFISHEIHMRRGTSPEHTLQKIKEVVEIIGEVPSIREFVRICKTQRYKHLAFKYFGSWKNALKKLNLEPKVRRINYGPRNFYTRKELLELLLTFALREKRIPTDLDCGFGILPDADRYRTKFGTLDKARRKAGIYKFLRKHKYPNEWKRGTKYGAPL